MRIGEYLDPLDIVDDLKSSTKEDVLRELIAKLLERRQYLHKEEILQLLLERERLGSTGFGGGVALPHAKTPLVGKPILVFGRSKAGIAYDALDGKPVYLFFLLISDLNSIGVYLTILARVSRLLKDRTFRGSLLNAEDSVTIYARIEEQDLLP
ncbi:MAG: PTS sugar transporter subunit IIA [Geobacteraceae bacterium]|nr:PTS sugar transporter subunit IIA [Geobacteraceae bacterium]